MSVPASSHVSSRGAPRADRWFFSVMALAIAFVVFVGFAPSFYLRNRMPAPHPYLPLTPLVVTHGLAFTGWILFLVLQNLLVAGGRTDIHRKLGVFGACLAAFMVPLGILAALHGALRGSGPPGSEPMSFLAVPLFAIINFGILVAAGIWTRRIPATHKRLMLLSTIAIIDAAIARWRLGIMAYGPPAFFGVTDLFLLALIVFDLARFGRIHRATLWGGGLILLSQPGRLMISHTHAWSVFAHWATGLVA